MSDERYSRQRDLVPEKKLSECNITVIGIGAIGRQVALQLSAMGARKLQLIDHDHVEESNIASQGYYEADLKAPKVIATGNICASINKDLDINQIYSRYKRSEPVGNIIFCCVDKIDTRKMIWNEIGAKSDFFVDGRMSGEVLRVINAWASDPKSVEYYPSTLFAAADAHAGTCTAKSTIYCANIAAGRMVSRFAMWLRGIPLEYDIMLNLVSDELIIKSA
ncbi:MAG: ThiF family adenylyltransferase [Promethearchaeota archaeon]|jgi:sulfur carrier protein ThiS adenylyltransferase